MGLLAVGGGCYGLTRIHQPLAALVIAAPYVLAAIVFVVTGATRQRQASAFLWSHSPRRSTRRGFALGDTAPLARDAGVRRSGRSYMSEIKRTK
jgi:hypothetical protein